MFRRPKITVAAIVWTNLIPNIVYQILNCYQLNYFFRYFSTCDYGWFKCIEPYVCGVRECEEGRIQKVTGLHDENYQTTVIAASIPATDDISDLYTTGSFWSIIGAKYRSSFLRGPVFNHICSPLFCQSEHQMTLAFSCKSSLILAKLFKTLHLVNILQAALYTIHY